MITLVTVLGSWRERYQLSTEQWSELGEQLSLSLDHHDHRFPPMPADLADRIGVRTYYAAVTKLIKERLLGGLPDVSYEQFQKTHNDVPKQEVIAETPTVLRPAPQKPQKEIKRRRCSSCLELGHYSRTCKRFPRG